MDVHAVTVAGAFVVGAVAGAVAVVRLVKHLTRFLRRPDNEENRP